MLSLIMLLPSCMVAYRTPQYDGQGNYIERNDRGMNHHRGMRHHRSERYNSDDRQNRDVRHD